MVLVNLDDHDHPVFINGSVRTFDRLGRQDYYMFQNSLDSIVHMVQVSFQFCRHFKDDACNGVRGHFYLQHRSHSLLMCYLWTR